MSDRSKYRLKITAPAIADIEAIAAYTSRTWGEGQARIYASALDRTIRSIADAPSSGRERFGVPSAIKGRRSGSHIIFYRVEDAIIYIMRILHVSMDHGRHLNADD